MPSFKFQGFATGQAVALSVTQGAETEVANVATWGEVPSTGSLTLGVSSNRVSGVAPMGALFSADATSTAARVESPYHDIEGTWSFDDPGSFSALGNSPLWGVDSNLGYGPRGTHVFSQPGTYAVAHTAYDGEGQLTKTTSVTVEDPDVVFAGANTAVVSAAGNFAGKPAGAAEFTTIAAAVSHLSTRANPRLLLRYDETFTDAVVLDNTTQERPYIGRFGHGASSTRPLIDVSGSGVDAIKIGGANVTEAVVCDIRVLGSYDPTATSQPAVPSGSAVEFENETHSAHKTIHNCRFENIGGTSINVSTNDAENPMENLYISNSQIIGWFDYGILMGDGGNVGIMGCEIMQPTGTVNGSGKNNGAPYWPDHGCFRLTRPSGMVVVSNCSMSSFNDWSSGNTSRSMQPVIRWNSGSNNIHDQELVIDRIRTEGGTLAVHTGTGKAAVGDNFVIVDRFQVVSTFHPRAAIVSPMGGVTWRNGILVIPNTLPGSSTGTREIFTDEESDSYQSGAGVRRSEFYSNALIDLRSNTKATNRSGSVSRDFKPGGYTTLNGATYFGENLMHAPRLSGSQTGTTQHAPLDDTPTANVIYDGERWEGGSVDTSRAYSDEVTALFKPKAGSPAIGGATGKVSLLDFDGTLRTTVVAGLSRSTFSVGPFEPDLET